MMTYRNYETKIMKEKNYETESMKIEMIANRKWICTWVNLCTWPKCCHLFLVDKEIVLTVAKKWSAATKHVRQWDTSTTRPASSAVLVVSYRIFFVVCLFTTEYKLIKI